MTEEDKQNSQEHQFGPGALLKRTREEQGLSLNEVSSRLKLTLPVLNNIEADNYVDDLPITFYRGYIKNYAELLAIDESGIVSNFQEYCQKNNLFKAPAPKLQGLQLDKPLNSSNWLFKIVTTVIILALLFSIYYVLVEKELWKKFQPESNDAQSTELQTGEAGSGHNGLLIGNGGDGDSSAVSSEQTVSEDDLSGGAQSNGSASLQINEEPSSSLNSRLNQANEAANPNVGDSDVGDSDVGDSDDEASSSTVSKAVVEQSSVDNADSGTGADSSGAGTDSSGGSLYLSFTADCWVRIQDASGKVLALGIKSAGSNLQLSGQTPYSLTLGKASAVQLSYDGNSVDLSNYPDTRAAKLLLGE